MSSIFNMLYSNVVPFVILLSILVFVHELGHFLVARFNGVRVEVFSLGFGKKILQYKKGETVYCISLIPFGGYVKMFGEQPGSVVTEEEKSVSFTHKTVWQRMAIVLAGPLMNFCFAVFLFWLIAFTGEETRSAKLAEVQPESVAAIAGLKSNDTIKSVNSVSVRTYEEFQSELNNFKDATVNLVVQNDNEEERQVTVKVTSGKNPNIFSTQTTIAQIEGILPYAKGTTVAVSIDSTAYKAGFRTGDEITKVDGSKISSWSQLEKAMDGKTKEFYLSSDKKISFTTEVKKLEELGFEHPEMYLDQVMPDSPAAKADLKKYDKIISINGELIKSWDQILNTIKSYDGKDALTVTIQRDGMQLIKKITPHMTSQMTSQGQEDKRYTIGIVPMINYSMPETVKIADGFIPSVKKGFTRAYDISAMTVISFVRMFQGQVSHKNIGGLVSIGKAAKDSYQQGSQAFLMTMAILSISLFILNLLPIPVLDGGHMVFYIIEAIKGSPLSIKKMELFHQIGFALLMGLMVLALFNDVTKFFIKS